MIWHCQRIEEERERIVSHLAVRGLVGHLWKQDILRREQQFLWGGRLKKMGAGKGLSICASCQGSDDSSNVGRRQTLGCRRKVVKESS